MRQTHIHPGMQATINFSVNFQEEFPPRKLEGKNRKV
jgi:hypothetical protein